MGRDPNKIKRVFPSNNFDSEQPGSTDGGSGTDVPVNKEDEARKAARLAIHEGTITHSPDRTITTIFRGEYLKLEQLGEFKRQRKYLVSSDLSPQATYAMEWAIGTVLREGDTLWVTQALGKDDEACDEKDREHNCHALVEETKRLLKRTRLQVKIIVEIVAAKVPKHMITEMVFLTLLDLLRSIIFLPRWLFLDVGVGLLSRIFYSVPFQPISSQNLLVLLWSHAKNSKNLAKRASAQLVSIMPMED